MDPGSLAKSDGPLLWSDDGNEWDRLRACGLTGAPACCLSCRSIRSWSKSSIVLSVTAVEVELKRLLSAVVPEAEWLAPQRAGRRQAPRPQRISQLAAYEAAKADMPPTKKDRKTARSRRISH